MGVIVVMLFGAIGRNYAAIIRNGAIDVLKLNGRVMQMKPIAQHVIHPVQDAIAP